jgi:hypothetical protein
VRIDLADGSSQVYDTRAVSRALFAATTMPDALGYGPNLGYVPTAPADVPLPPWATTCTPWEPITGDGGMSRMVRRTFGDGCVIVDAVQDLAPAGHVTVGEPEVVLPGGRTVLGVEELEEVGRALLEAAQLLAGYDPTPTVMHPAGTTPGTCPDWCQTDHDGIDAPEQHDGPTWVPVPATGGYRSAQVSAGAREDGGMVVYLAAPGLALSAADARTAGHALLAAAYWVDDHDAGAR